MFDKYLDNNVSIASSEDLEENKKDYGKEKSSNEKRGPSQIKVEEYSVQEIINQIKFECRSFLIAEFKLILMYGLIISVSFYFFGKNELGLFFIFFFLLGILLSLICAYYVTSVAVSNCEIVLNQSQ